MRDLEVGVFLHSLGIRDPAEAVRKAHELGFTCIQMGALPEEYRTPEKHRALLDLIKELSINVSAVCASFAGESYKDIETVKETVGYRNPELRQVRIQRTLEIADEAVAFGAPIITTHIGVLPKDESDSIYQGMLEAVKHIGHELDALNLTFALETGQESAAEMKRFLEAVGRDNVRINFDPANMILYGTGNPIEALEVLKGYIAHVHVKDGHWPPEPGKLGSEARLGEGDVNIPAYVAKLKEIGYRGPLTIEREAGTTRIPDLQASKKMLEELR